MSMMPRAPRAFTARAPLALAAVLTAALLLAYLSRSRAQAAPGMPTDYSRVIARLDSLVARRRASPALGAAGIVSLRIGAAEPESPHVQHLARHGERYRAALADLLGKAARAKEARAGRLSL